MDPWGYLLYLLAVYLPGFGLVELLGINKKGRLAVEVIGYATGLGLAADTIVLFLGSSGIVIGSVPFLGVTINKFYALIVLGLASYALAAVRERKLPSYPRPGRYELLVSLMVLVQAAMLLLFFSKYPIFPEYNSADLGGHVNIVTYLLSSGSSVPGGILYYGVHYQLALGVLLTGDVPLIVVQRVGAILAVMGTFVVFLAGSRLFSNKDSGLIASFLYSVTASIWFGSLFNTGLYPNFFGILASLFVLALVVDLTQEGFNLGLGLALAGAVGLLYLSHYSDVSIIPAILVLPVLLLLSKQFQRRALLPAIFCLLPAALAVLLYPGFLGLMWGFLANAGGIVVGRTYLSGVLSPWPVLANMATETYYDLGFVLLLSLAALYFWRSLKERDAVKLLVPVWFLSVIVIAPLNQGAWRLAYVALVPLTMMASAELASLIPRVQKGTRRQAGRWKKYVVPLLLIVLFVGSWGVSLSADAFANTATSSQSQQDVYSAIMWVGNNTHGGSFLSVSDYRFLYMPQLIGRSAAYEFLSTPAQGLSVARSGGYSYIIVTQLVTAALPPNPNLFPWNNFPISSDGNLTLVYSNSDVRIYQVA